MALLMGSCTEAPRNEPAVSSTQSGDAEVTSAPADPAPLPEQRDQYGLLPATIAGWKVSRGAAAGYVPDLSCKECHATEWSKFATSGMSKSFYRPDPAEAFEDLGKPFYHQATRRYYEMNVRDGKYRLKRYCKDARDQRFAELEIEVAWVMGVGKPTRAYIAQNAHGELYQLPLCWYDECGWGMAPGFDRKDHQRFERMLNRDCMSCHSAYPETPLGSDLPHKPHVFPQQIPAGIGCQRCHGPGARHLEWANRPGAAKQTDARPAPAATRILNPATFNNQQRDDLCLSCHLEIEMRHCNLLIRAFDRPMHSLQPGMDLTEFVFHLDHGTRAQRQTRVQAGGQAYRLRWSRCFTQSDGKLTCLTCHDPHGKVPKAQHAAHYRQKCFECHAITDCEMEEMGKQRDPAKSDCIACHMFESRPVDVVHVVIRDHLIRRFPPDRDLTVPRPETTAERQPLDILPFFPDRSGKHPMWEVYAGFGTNYTPSAASVQKWLAAFERTKPHVEAAYVNIARGLMEYGGSVDALQLLREGVELHPECAEMHWTLGQALHNTGQYSAALAPLTRARKLHPNDPGIEGSLADTYARLGDHNRAKTHFHLSLGLRPGSAVTWQHYGYTLFQLGELDAAAEAFGHAIACNPEDGYAYRTLSSIRQKQGQSQAAQLVLEQAGSRLPDLQLDLIAFLLVPRDAARRDVPGALKLATAAAREHPDSARTQLHLALALLLSRQSAKAETTLDQALNLGADSASVNAMRALLGIQREDRSGAEEYLEKLRWAAQSAGQERLRPVLLELLQRWIRSPPKSRQK